MIVTDDGNNNPVGLLFAGSSSHTIANRIDLVLAKFGVTIDGAAVTPVTDVAVTEVSAPASVVQGDDVSVDVTVRNVGNQNVGSVNVTLEDLTADVPIGTQTVASLAAGASTTLTYSWNTTGASLGSHTLEGSHDLADDDADDDINNNAATTAVTVNEPPPPGGGGVTVGGIDPNSMQAGTSIGVTITGTGFADGADVTFENGSGPTPTASNVVFNVDDGTITATVTVKGGGRRGDRVWDVRVTNVGGSSEVLVAGFTVTR